MTSDSNTAAPTPATAPPELVQVRLPVWWTFGGLVAGLGAGIVLSGTAALPAILEITGPVGAMWLRGLQMTIIPLVASLLVLGITQMMAAARAGPVAIRMLVTMFVVLAGGAMATALLMPVVLSAFPVPDGAAALLMVETGAEAQDVPGVGDFLTSLVAPNLIAAAAETAMLPLTIFFALFAVALAGLPEGQRHVLVGFFHAVANVMLTIIGWVLWLAPVGVFALALGVSASSGADAFGALAHYIAVVSGMGLVVLVAAYALGMIALRGKGAGFARAMLPAQAVAISTQSSLASLPAMLDSARRLRLRDATSDFVLPLAVAIFRSTSPAMNLAVEMLPDIMRTLANVTMNVAVTASVDRSVD